MLSSGYEKVCFSASALSAEKQREFIEEISAFCSEEELKALLVGIGYFRMLRNPDTWAEIAHDMARELYHHFTEEAKA